MSKAHENFLESLLDEFSSETIAYVLVIQKLKEMDFEITQNDHKNIRLALQEKLNSENKKTNFQFDLENYPDVEETIALEITNEDIQDFEENIYPAFVERSMKLFTEETGNSLYNAWLEQSEQLLQDVFENDTNILRIVERKWGKPLNTLRMMIDICTALGSSFNDTHRSDAAENNNLVFEALTHLHARGCQIAWEGYVLLKNGFADGANARWRALHEVSVTASFIKTYGDDVAKRYLLHYAVDEYKLMQQFNEFGELLGYEPISEEDLNEAELIKKKLIKQFGKSYWTDYGWAANALKSKRPTFREIEQAAELEHLRPYYKLANAGIHATSLGNLSRLGLPENKHMLLVGPSILGLDHVGNNIASTIGMLTLTVLNYITDVEYLASAYALLEVRDLIYKEFYEIDTEE